MNLNNLIKSIYENPSTNIVLNGEMLDNFSLKSGIRERCLLLPLLLNTVLEILAKVIRHKKEKASIGKEEVKLSLFTDDMIFYVENPIYATRKLLELINELVK